MKILLIEDNHKDACQIREILREDDESSLDLLHVKHLEDGLALSQQEKFDVILVNIDLAEYNSGASTIVEIKKKQPLLPIVALTTADNEELAEEAVYAGAQDYLLKDQLDRPLLMRTIRYAIEKSQILNSLNETKEAYSLALAGARDGIWDWNLETNNIYFSPRWKSMLGWLEHEISDTPQEWLGRVHPNDIKQLEEDIEVHLRGKTDYFENEHRLQSRDGRYHWINARGIALHCPNGPAYRMAGSITDITDRYKNEEQQQHDALHDTLTGLPNRLFFMRLVSRALERNKNESHHQIAVLFIDMDRYKTINDSLGHTTGDQLLIEFAKRLESCLRPGDIVARLGGDEFTVFLDKVEGTQDAVHVAERIIQDLEIPFSLENHEIFITTSIGIALGNNSYNNPGDLLRDADIAMYQAKIKRTSHYEVFDPNIHIVAVDQLGLEMDLRRAIAQKTLEVYYQPIVNLISGHISGFEALARWQRNGIYVPPSHFIATAEETGLIFALGETVLITACQQLKTWQDQDLVSMDLKISVNLSSKQFKQPDFEQRIEAILNETSLNGDNLHLEITESSVLENIESITESLNKLKQLGIGFSMDDFGTGYASLSSLHRLPIDTLKVDRSFINDNERTHKNKVEMIRTIIDMAHNLGMDVIAEGIESEDLIQQLQEFNCESGQGFFFSPPIDNIAATQMLTDKPQWSWTTH